MEIQLETVFEEKKDLEIVEQPKCTYCGREAVETMVQPALCEKHLAVAEMVHVARKHNLGVELVNVRRMASKYAEYWPMIRYDEIPYFYRTLRSFCLFELDHLFPLFPEEY